MTATRTLAAIALVACIATGCADPYEQKPPSNVRGDASADASPAATPGRSARPIPPARRPTPGRSARVTARRFATRWVNWDWRSAAAQQRALARLATGALAAQLRASARATRANESLRRDTPGMRGAVAAINLRTRAGHARGLIVTREQTYTAGRADLGGRRYHVYLIELVASARGWEVTAWQPQP
jgi:hypothetical protein